jgi:hypothetical protein
MSRIWRPLIVLGLLACLTSSVAAQEEGLSMNVVPGFDGYCRQENWCPVLILLSNEGTDVEGELQIEIPGSAGIPSDTYIRAVTLPAHSRKAYFIHIPFAMHALRFDVQLSDGRRVLASQAVALRTLDETDRLYAVVGSAPSDFNFLADVEPSGGDAVVSHLNLEWLPAESIGWEAIDALVLNDVDTTQLSLDQRQAMETWLSHGGHLVVGGGAGAARTAAGVGDLLPVTVGGLETVGRLDALGAPVVEGPFPVVETTLQSGEALIEQDGLILMARRAYGAGTVDFLAFDAGLNPFARTEDQQLFWENTIRITAREAWQLTVRDVYNARRAAASIPGLKAPSILQIMAFLLAYIILVGPVNYLVLRKLKRREWAWLTIPVVVIAFTGCAYVTGFQIRGRTPFINRLSVVYTPQNANRAQATELVGFFSPRRGAYELQVEGGSIGRIKPEDYMYGYYSETDPPGMWITQDDQASTLTDFRVNVGEIYTFFASGYVESTSPESELEVTIRASGHPAITGSIRNGPFALENAVLILGRNRVILGDLAPDQTVTDFENLEESSSLSESIFPGTGSSPWRGYVETDRIALVEAFFPSAQSYTLSGIYLVGWTDTAALDTGLEEGDARTSDLTLHIFELSAVQRGTGESVVIPASLIGRELESSTGYVEITDDQIFISSGSTAIFRFTPWAGTTIDQVSELTLKLSETGYAHDVPMVALWNWETKEWDQQSVTLGENIFPDADDYVDPEGGVRVRLEVSSTQYIELKDLTISIRGQQQ